MKMLMSSFGGYTPKISEIMIDKTLKFPYCYFNSNIDFTKIEQLSDVPDFNKLFSIEENKTKIFSFNSNEKLYLTWWFDSYCWTASFTEINTKRPWTIDWYDGASSIQYLDTHQLFDKELNYYEEKRG